MKRVVVVVAALLAACLPIPQAQSQPTGAEAGQPVAAADPSAFTGRFTAGNATVELGGGADGQIAGTIEGNGVTGTIQGVVDGTTLSGELVLGDGTAFSLVGTATADAITLVLDGQRSMTLQRAAGADPDTTNFGKGHGRSPPTAKPTTTATTADPGKPAPKPTAKAATGTAYRDNLDGWEVRTPAKWKYGVKAATVVFGSDTEPGVIVVGYRRGVSYDQMAASVDAVVAQLGATQVGAATPFKTKAGKGLVVEMTGTAPDGTTLHARAAGIAGPDGVVTVTGITTPAKIAALRKRVDAIARSAKFFTPEVGPAMQALVGPWWHYHGNDTGSYSSSVSTSFERTIELCADGTFFDSSQSVINAQSADKNPNSDSYGSGVWGNKITPDAGNGRWTATGDDAAGHLRLVFNSGTTEDHDYVFKKRGGGDIELDGRWYGRAPDKGGQCR